MTCVHLRQLYKLCENHDLKLSSSDLIRMVCHQCGEQEMCPATLTDEYDATQSRRDHEKETTNKQHAEDSAGEK